MFQGRVRFEATAAVGRGMGGYIGARRDRAATAEWNPGGGSPQVDISPDLPMLRDRSRDQMRNAPVALGALTTDVLHVVGTGLSYTPAIDAKRLGISEERAQEWMEDTKWRFKAWADSPDCDYRRQLDFYSQVELAYRSWKESGDCFVLTPMLKRNGEDMLVLQLVEADRVCNPRGQQDSDKLQDGVVLDPETGTPTAIHVSKNHPGDWRGTNEWTEVQLRGKDTDRRNVLHLMDVLRPGQVRGVPWIAPIIEPLKQLQKWSDAELNAAVVTSIFAIFMEMDAEAFGDLYDDTAASKLVNSAEKWSGKMESGKAVNLLPGEKANMVTPGRPNPEFDPFWNATVRQIGMALGMPHEVLTMHFQSSYTAARGALLMAWRGFSQRREKLAKLMCQPVLELWLANEVSAGRISCPGFFADRTIRAAWCASMWTGDGPGSVDPVKEITAAEKRVAMGVSTLQAESIAYDGQDFEAKHRQRAKEVAMQKRDGTAPAAMPGSVPAAAAPSDPGNGDDTDLETQPPQRQKK
ncbi:phage portal protein, lambda family [Polaromonas sp. CF318]|nr:phage portal protein, lambda family [Polaromonas sp. CF318]